MKKIIETVFGLGNELVGMKMERKVLKNIIKIINELGSGLVGMITDKKVPKDSTTMIKLRV